MSPAISISELSSPVVAPSSQPSQHLLTRPASHFSHSSKQLQSYPFLIHHCFVCLSETFLEYGNEIWGCYPAEELHKRFCKFALGVPRIATNLACYGELGRTPLSIKRKVSLIKYWLMIEIHQTWSKMHIMHLLNLKPCNGQSVSKTFSTMPASHKCGPDLPV